MDGGEPTTSGWRIQSELRSTPWTSPNLHFSIGRRNGWRHRASQRSNHKIPPQCDPDSLASYPNGIGHRKLPWLLLWMVGADASCTGKCVKGAPGSSCTQIFYWTVNNYSLNMGKEKVCSSIERGWHVWMSIRATMAQNVAGNDSGRLVCGITVPNDAWLMPLCVFIHPFL